MASQVYYSSTLVKSWADFIGALRDQDGRWIYRGQQKDWQLCTSLERALLNWNIDLTNAPAIERQMIRDFRRQYRGEHYARVNNDTLDCLALMQHHGAPTRLLDWTYSPFVAAKFAINGGSRDGVIWCLNVAWCNDAVMRIVDEQIIRGRDTDTSRNDTTFVSMYMNDLDRRRFVYSENPFHLNERLIVQQGAFLCPGDISFPLSDNLSALDGGHSRDNIIKFTLDFDGTSVREFAKILMRMNVDSAVLFPGLDGFARSITERLFLYEDLGSRRTAISIISDPS